MADVIVAFPLCNIELMTPRPVEATDDNWTVQYFNGAIPITAPALTANQWLLLPPGEYLFTARWEKAGETTIVTDINTWTITGDSTYG